MERLGDKYIYDGKFDGNIKVGWIGCGKTTFIQKLGKNKMFREEILEVFWVLKINLSEAKEESIRASFEDQNVYFHYPSDLEDFNYLITNFTQKKSSYTDENNTLGENLITNKLIVMDDVPGLADKSEDFSNFFSCFKKGWIFVRVCFSYDISWKTKLGNDNVSNTYF